MTSATSSGVTTSYQYNGLGERVKKSNSGGTVYFAYDEAGHLAGEYDASGDLIQETVWLNDIAVATLRADGQGGVETYYVHTDHLNTPRRVTRPSDDEIVWQWDSDPFGSTAADEDPDADQSNFVYNLRFPGQYLDDETGLYYNYFRDYDPVIGRYPQPDPIGLLGGINPYSYALNNPIGLYDPYGLWVPPSLPQSVVDAVTGFGDGAYAAVTLGLGDLQDVRDLIGVDGNVDACSDAYGAFNVAGMGVGSVALAGAGSIKALQYTGPLRNWLRFGRSYSQSLGQEVRLSLRWGASPAKQGKYLRQIPSQTLRQLNQWLRQQRIPLPGWRYADPGHLHIWP